MNAKELQRAWKAISRIAQMDLSAAAPATRFQVARMIREIRPLVEDLEATRVQDVLCYARRGEDGRPVVLPGGDSVAIDTAMLPEYLERMREIDRMEIEVRSRPLQAAELADVGAITPELLADLGEMLILEDE